jgi:hypothetical protein
MFLSLVLAALALLAFTDGAEGVEYHSDVELTGVFEDTRIDIWGNITVPENGTLELYNVSVVFQGTGTGTRGLRALLGSNLTLADGDDDPSTLQDRTRITSDESAWFLMMDRGTSFEVRGALLSMTGRSYTDPDLGPVTGFHINALDVDLDDLTVDRPHVGMTIDAFDLFVNGSDLGFEPLGINLMGSTITISNTTLDFGMMTIQPGLSVRLLDCSIEGTTFYSRVIDGFELRGCDLVLPYIGVWASTDAFDAVIVDSSFESNGTGTIGFYGIYGLYSNSYVVNSTFSGYTGGIYSRYTNLVVELCTFTNVQSPVRGDDAKVEVLRSSMSNFTIGVMATRSMTVSPSSLTVHNCSFEGGGTAVASNGVTSGVYVKHSDFLNLTEGVSVNNGLVVNISRCYFNNTTMGIYMSPDISVSPNLTITDNVLIDFQTAIRCSVSRGLISGNVLRGFSYKGGSSVGIDVGRYKGLSSPSFQIILTIRDNLVENCSLGLHYHTFRGPTIKPILRIEDLVISNCTDGIWIWNATRVDIEGVQVIDSEFGASLSQVKKVQILSISIHRADNGLVFNQIETLTLVDIIVTDITDSALSTHGIETGDWIVRSDTVFEDCDIYFEGSMSVSRRLELRRVTLRNRGDDQGPGNIDVFPAAELILDESTLGGFLARAISLVIHDGASLNVTNSTISYCGAKNRGLEGTGPYVVGGNVKLNGLVTENCYRGLVLNQSRAVIAGGYLNGTDAGLVAIGSQMTLTGTEIEGNRSGASFDGSIVELWDCDVKGVVCGILSRESTIDMNGSRIQAIYISLDLFKSNFTVWSSNVDTSSSLFRLIDSKLDLWTSTLTKIADPGSVLGESRLRLYNTSSPPNWTLSATNTSVEVWWSFDITAVYRWNGAYAAGETVNVTRREGVEEVATFVLPHNQTSERLWLLGTIVFDRYTKMFGPYNFSIAGVEKEAFIESDALEPFTGTLVIVDPVDPLLDVDGPSWGVYYNTTRVSLTGTASDMGSGISSLAYSIDNSLWNDLDAPNGKWFEDLILLDGEHTVTVRVEDRDGNLVEEHVEFHVDTTPPVAAFRSPIDGSVVGDTTVLLEGFVIVGTGSPLSKVYISDVLVYAGVGEPNLTYLVVLPADGPHTFSITAIDLVGNTGHGYVTVSRDISLPLVHVDHLPKVTNQREIPFSGTCTDAHITTVSLDGYHVATLVNGSFKGNLSLEEGWNEFQLTAEDFLGNLRTLKLRVELDTELAATIIEPKDQSRYDSKRVWVHIEADPDAVVWIQGLTSWVNASDNGTISMWVHLDRGKTHTLVFEFRDRANNSFTQTVTVSIDKLETVDEPIPIWVVPIVAGITTAGVIVVLIYRRRLVEGTDGKNGPS